MENISEEWPKIYCETERLIIRPAGEEDYRRYVDGFANCGPMKNRFDEQFDASEMTEDWFRALLTRRAKEARDDYAYKFMVIRKSDGVSVGYCNVFPHYRADFQYAHVGYAIHNNYWNNGYATECVSALITIGFKVLKLHRLEAHVNLDNPASKKVLLKAGFSFECVRKSFIYEDGKWTDNEIYYINNDALRL